MIDGKILVLDQTQLPNQEKWLSINTVEEMVEAISNLSIRGAPLLGLAGLYGLYCAAKQAFDFQDFQVLSKKIRNSRPTAVNLSKMVDIELKKQKNITNLDQLKDLFLQHASSYEKELTKESFLISQNGSSLLETRDCILTHCNTGSLATIGLGTALGVIKYGHMAGKNISVFFTETRPLMQGARLTSYELMKAKIASTMICDDSVGFWMQKKMIDKVIVGADRIALNGDTANKIGTYSIAVQAYENNVPFYIAAPTSTIDSLSRTGDDITIEFRDPKELASFPIDSRIKSINPAFDVTPAKYISGFITEKGILNPPFS